MNPFTQFLKQQVIPWVAATVLRLFAATFRIEMVDPEGVIAQPPEGPMIFAFWHNRLLFMGHFYRRYFPGRSGVAMISRSRDGEIISRILRHFRIEAARGSSSKKGNLAAREVIRKVTEEGCDVALTPDGPRGPRYRVQPGIVQIAQLTGRPILPVSYEFGWRKELRSWDRMPVPYPFSRCRIVLKPMIHVPAELTPEEFAEYCRKIGEELGE